MPPKKKPVVTILVPMYNEELVLPLLFDELNRVTGGIRDCDFVYLFVDDGSKDASVSIVKNYASQDSRVRFLALSRNFGKEKALLAGFDHPQAAKLEHNVPAKLRIKLVFGQRFQRPGQVCGFVCLGS